MARAALKKLLGESVMGKDGKPVPIEQLPSVVGIYFSAHWCPPCRGFTPVLAAFYKEHKEFKNFEIVFASSDQSQAEFDEYYAEHPWLCIPFGDPRKPALSKKFKVRGIPALIFLDSDTGKVICENGREQVTSDKRATKFPWSKKTLMDILDETLINQENEEVPVSSLKDKYLMFYFSAHWCPPCKGFTPVLSEYYKKLKAKRDDFELIFVSGDRDPKTFREYYRSMAPWLALPFGDDRISDLNDLFGVDGIPTLVIVDKNGQLITSSGRGFVSDDAEGVDFPYFPKPVMKLGPAALDAINGQTCVLVFTDKAGAAEAVEALTPLAEADQKAAKEAEDDPKFAYIVSDGSHGLHQRLLDLTKSQGRKLPFTAILNVSDEKYYINDSVNHDALESFLQMYQQKVLDGHDLEL